MDEFVLGGHSELLASNQHHAKRYWHVVLSTAQASLFTHQTFFDFRVPQGVDDVFETN